MTQHGFPSMLSQTSRLQWSHVHTNACVYNYCLAQSSQKGSIMWHFHNKSDIVIKKKMTLLKSDITVMNFSYATSVFSVLLTLRQSRWTLKNRISSRHSSSSCVQFSLPAFQVKCLSVSCERMRSISRWRGRSVLLSNPNGSTTLSSTEKKTQCVLWHGKHFSRRNAACGRDSRQKVLCSSSCFVIWGERFDENFKVEKLPQLLNSIWKAECWFSCKTWERV